MKSGLAFMLLFAALAACAREDGSAVVRNMPDVRLATLAGPLAESLATCPTERCLTVIVAPWCGVCRAEAPNISLFSRWLAQHGVSMRVIIGLSSDSRAVRAFAATFGPDALIDADVKIQARSTPTFLVSDRSGRILKVLEGFPTAARGPSELARLLGLI